MRNNSSRVRGPNSALTEFLRVEGITDAFKEKKKEQEASSPARSRRSRQSSRATSTAATTPDSQEDQTPEWGVSDDDDGSDGPILLSDGEDGEVPAQMGQEEICADCGNPFTLSVYSRYMDVLKGYICEDCNEIVKEKERKARKNQASARKRRKKLAKALLNKKAVRIATLQDLCIQTITANIDQVKALGNIGQAHINKISQILSKNRSLNDSTVTLFLNPNVKALEFWDCSNVSSDSFNKIAAYCSGLTSLTLFMCGQFHNDNLNYYQDKLPNLRKLALNGPFLISDVTWQAYFDNEACKLEQFEVRNTHRFPNNSLISLLEKRGVHLTSLKLSRLDGIDSAAVYELIPQSISPASLTELELSHPSKPELISDDLLIHILAITGESLQSLNVDGCSALTDSFLIEGIAKFCPNLRSLSMRSLDQITNEGFTEAFKEFPEINYGGLTHVDLTKCIDLGDSAVAALIEHSGKSLVELSLNSLNKLTSKFLLNLLTDVSNSNGNGHTDSSGQDIPKGKLPYLTKLDIGFVRGFNDEVAESFSEHCPKLAILEVFGNNKCTLKAQIRPEILVIGRQAEDAQVEY